MRAASVRKLENTPSNALRMAQTDAVVLTSCNRREAVLMHLDEKALLAQPGLRTTLAFSLLEDHALPLGRAARLAGTVGVMSAAAGRSRPTRR